MAGYIQTPEWVHTADAVDVEQMGRYKLGPCIGSGEFGSTYMGHDSETGSIVAIKILHIYQIDENVKREVMNHRELLHRNIIGFVEVFLSSENLCIVMEYANGGNIQEAMQSGKWPQFRWPITDESEAKYFFKQLLDGVWYLHKKGICHRDLKPENTLLTFQNDIPVLKVCDFGLSKSFQRESVPNTSVGTHHFVAPEVVSEQRYDGMKADVWQCGVFLFYLMSGVFPFSDPAEPSNIQKSIQKIITADINPYPATMSASCKDLLRRIFVINPDMRPNMEMIYKHPWLSKGFSQDYVQVEAKDMARQSIKEIEQILQTGLQLKRQQHNLVVEAAREDYLMKQ